tara:strand:- start:1215 stop:1598 length:384 start_codon:yes stop_codon:yes gene_type:complete
MENLIKAIRDNNPTEVKKEFGLELGKRSVKMVDDRKKEVALSLFNSVPDEEDSEPTTTEEQFLHNINNIKENEMFFFDNGSKLVVNPEMSKAFVSLYESASDINKVRLLNIAKKSNRGFLKVIKLTR